MRRLLAILAVVVSLTWLGVRVNSAQDGPALKPIYTNRSGAAISLFTIAGDSMLPTFANGDVLLIDGFAFSDESPDRGDIIVFHPPIESTDSPVRPYVKRVIALPGETVEIADGVVIVDGFPMAESYIVESTDCENAACGPVTVGEDEVYVLGDNRNNSSDSRTFGPVPYLAIEGKAFYLDTAPTGQPID